MPELSTHDVERTTMAALVVPMREFVDSVFGAMEGSLRDDVAQAAAPRAVETFRFEHGPTGTVLVATIDGAVIRTPGHDMIAATRVLVDALHASGGSVGAA